MSMSGVFRHVSPRALALVEERPELAGPMIDIDWRAAPAAPLPAGLVDEEEERFEELRATGITEADLPDTLDILKTWHGLHFLLAGARWDAGPGAAQAILGGREIGDEVVYGPARILSVAETAEVATALAALTETELASRFDPAAMHAAEIYGTWDDLEWLLQSFRDVRGYYASARERGFGMLLAIV